MTQVEITGTPLLARKWLMNSIGKGNGATLSIRQTSNKCLLAALKGVDVLPTFGGALEPRSPEAKEIPRDLVLWVFAVVMVSQSRKSKIIMTWLFWELLLATWGLRLLLTNLCFLFSPRTCITCYECGDREMNFWSTGK